MRGEVHILVHCPNDTLQWGSTHSAMLCLLLVSRKRECPLIQSGRQRHLILISEFAWWFCLNEIDKIDS